ncbi:MAG: PBS lyase [Symploca sp. SIO2G7]|nr:PBS lyase [Symploca sp. SIO2G7]
MRLISIETTPSPNCIKLNLDEAICQKALTLKQGSNMSDAPEIAQQLMAIEAVQSVFIVQDFITLTRKGRSDWQPILVKAADVIGVADNADAKLLSQVAASIQPNQTHSSEAVSDLGLLEVAVQMFRGIPLQIRATAADGQQARVSLPDRFAQALQRTIAATDADYVTERRWEPYQAPAGEPTQVAQLVADEIDSLFDCEDLARIEAAAIANGAVADSADSVTQQQMLVAELSHPDWKHRLKALQQIDVTAENFAAVVTVLDDEKSSIRRWASALLGASTLKMAVTPLCRLVRHDPSAMVRRTAGDALSDIGDASALDTMAKALTDDSKLVRWRAARFLNELGDQTVVAPLQQAAAQESEFDVRVEIAAALERIEIGGETQLPMWMRLTQGIETD